MVGAASRQTYPQGCGDAGQWSNRNQRPYNLFSGIFCSAGRAAHIGRGQVMEAWRLIVDGSCDGPTNMAIDEAILEAVGRGDTPPTLRLFRWQPACLSLGYAQPAADADMDRIKAHGWDIVRRMTGGRAILHTDE